MIYTYTLLFLGSLIAAIIIFRLSRLVFSSITAVKEARGTLEPLDRWLSHATPERAQAPARPTARRNQQSPRPSRGKKVAETGTTHAVRRRTLSKGPLLETTKPWGW